MDSPYSFTGRLPARPELTRIVVAVDPPVTATAGSDSCGIIIAGLGADGRGYVIGDRTIQGREPAVWAHAAVAAYHDYRADRIVVETNQGGDLVGHAREQTESLSTAGRYTPAWQRYLRAIVSVLYAQGRAVAPVGGEDPELERQMTSPPTASPTARAPIARRSLSGAPSRADGHEPASPSLRPRCNRHPRRSGPSPGGRGRGHDSPTIAPARATPYTADGNIDGQAVVVIRPNG